MIAATISGAQLDTVDPAELAAIVDVANAVDRIEARALELTGASFRLSLGLHGLTAAFVAAGQAMNRTRETLELHMPAPEFLEPPRVDFARPLANPRAPIPDRIRRRFDRGRDRR